MAETNESANGSKSEQSEKDSVFGFLTELTKTPVLFFFTIGIACLIFAISSNIPGVGKVPAWGSVVLLLVSGALVWTSYKDHRRTLKLQEQRDKYEKRYNEIAEELDAVQAKRNELDEAINKALELLETKENRDAIDSKVLQLLHERTTRLLQDIEGTADQKLVADWFRRRDRKSRLMSYLNDLNYSFLTDTSERKKFLNDIEAHLELLSRNIQVDGYRSPEVDGLKKSISDSSAYVRAFRDLKIEILREAEEDREMLKPSGINYLRRHVEAFIDLINA